MKRISVLAAAILLISILLCGCGQVNNNIQSKILIAYFTWAENIENNLDVDATASASVSLPGNVGQIAAWIQDEVGGDLFSIQVNEQYSADYDQCLDRAAEEKAQNARPALKNRVENFAEYDIITSNCRKRKKLF